METSAAVAFPVLSPKEKGYIESFFEIFKIIFLGYIGILLLKKMENFYCLSQAGLQGVSKIEI